MLLMLTPTQYNQWLGLSKQPKINPSIKPSAEVGLSMSASATLKHTTPEFSLSYTSKWCFEDLCTGVDVTLSPQVCFYIPVPEPFLETAAICLP